MEVEEGHPIAALGYPLRSTGNLFASPDLFSGIVSRIESVYFKDIGWRTKSLQLDLSIHPGNSGGPVFCSETGRLLGIVSAQRLRDLSLPAGDLMICGAFCAAAAQKATQISGGGR